MKELTEIVLQAGALIGASSVILALIGWLLKPRMVEWFQRELIRPIKATERAVTVNGNKDPNNPTVLDKLARLEEFQLAIGGQVNGIESKIDSIDGKVDAAAVNATEAAALAGETSAQLAKHLAWADTQVARLDELEANSPTSDL